MKILVIGNGGRESAIIDKIMTSSRFGVEIYQWPSNTCLPGAIPFYPQTDDISIMLERIRPRDFDLAVIGPESPLVFGVGDHLRGKEIPVFGPGGLGAKIEGDKGYAKDFMRKYDIPTADFEIVFGYEEGVKYLEDAFFPKYIKAAGLALGKGAVKAESYDEGKRILRDIFIEKKYGHQEKAVIEEYLPGTEVSMLAFVMDESYFLLPPARDYKKAFDNDEGPNTGGMGCIAPCYAGGFPDVSEAEKDDYKKWGNVIIGNALKGFKKEGIIYRGILYAGVIVNDAGYFVLEYNARFGDPETQSLLQLIDGDLSEILYKIAVGDFNISYSVKRDHYALTAILAARGYPEKYGRNIHIIMPDTFPENVKIFPAGLRKENGKYLSTGGRILGVTSIDPDLTALKKRVYDILETISNEKTFFRKDIGSVYDKKT